MSLTIYRARRSRDAQRVRAAVLFEAAVVGLTLAAIAIASGVASALLHL